MCLAHVPSMPIPTTTSSQLRSTSLLTKTVALLLAVGTYGCDDEDASIGEDELLEADAEDEPLEAAEALAAPQRIYDGEGFTLSTAQRPPEQRVRTQGPLTLRYVGPHRYVRPVEDVVEVIDESAEVEVETAPDIRLIDEQGHEWALSGFESEQAQALAAEHRAGLDELRALAAEDGHTNRGDVDDLAASPRPQQSPNWTEFYCGFSDKWRYDNGTMTDLDAVNDTQRRPILDTDNTGFNGTAVLVAENLALTAGHVANALVVGDSLCRRYGVAGTECRTVSSTIVSGNGGGDDDWGLVKFSTSFTGGWTYQLSDHTDGHINNFTPRIAAYPTLRMNEEAICGTSSLLEGERNEGDFHALLQKEARVDLTAGGGSSGAPYYFYENGEYWIFGVHSGRATTPLGNRYARGPKVPYWLFSITLSALALGVVL
jgi:V8-like Glu-specific endopeptidase